MMRKTIILSLLALAAQFGIAQDLTKKNMHYGNMSFQEEAYEDALEYFGNAVSYSPLDFKANFNLANTMLRLEDYEGAIKTYENILNLGPTSLDKSKAYHNLGNAKLMSQDLDGAIESYKQGLRLNPSDEELRYNLSWALQQKQQQEQEEQENGEDGSQGDQNGNQEENDANSDENSKQDQNRNEEDEKTPEEGNQEEANEAKQGDEKGDGQKYTNKMSKEEIQKVLDTYYKKEKDLQKRLEEGKRVGWGVPRKKDW
jgi:Ca-activated chloride channel family protein